MDGGPNMRILDTILDTKVDKSKNFNVWVYTLILDKNLICVATNAC